MIIAILAFTLSLVMCKVIVFTANVTPHIVLDHELNGIQKMHNKPVPRIGGAAIFSSLMFISIYGSSIAASWSQFYSGIIISIFFVFIGGFTEDVSKKVTPVVRMVFIIAAVIFSAFIVHAMHLIRDLHHDTLNYLLKYDLAAFFITCFAVLGISNAYNMIDGYNGLSAVTSILNLIGLYYLSNLLHDTESAFCCNVLMFAILGFLVYNYPLGKIFLGDGGSYVIGFMISMLSINLVETHKGMISPFAVLLLVAYPFTEAIFSIVRRKLVHKSKAMAPDNLHLHQLVFSRCIHENLSLLKRNARVMPLMLIMMIPQLVLVIFFYQSTVIMLCGLIGYFLFYSYMYVSLVKFRTPFILSLFSKVIVADRVS